MSQATNMRADEVIMDTRSEGQDTRYYCLPPFHGNAEREARKFYLVSQGRVVGVFDDWQAGGKGDHRTYKSMDESIVAWQGLCRLGLHPHPVDPEFEHTARAPLARAGRTPPPSTTTSSGAKQVEAPRRAGAGAPRNAPSRTERRYRELQSQGEEPELLVTRSLQEASFFAVDDGDEV
ncbi:hypothetical protein K438DRAFT_1961821 [Mycena galopus ATCC 62051]|nr:hypothetical protein K438DRAFT_1961821 [Mycena galopus ATCC 62051]